jgi:hypothetical protein
MCKCICSNHQSFPPCTLLTPDPLIHQAYLLSRSLSTRSRSLSASPSVLTPPRLAFAFFLSPCVINLEMLSSPGAPLFRRLSRCEDGPEGGLTSALGPRGGSTSSLSSCERLDGSEGREEMRACREDDLGFSTRSRLSRSRALRSRSAA